MTAENREDGPAPRFDPVAGMRAMADIQAEGLRAAGDLLERMLGTEQGPPGARPTAPSNEYAALVDAWVEVLRRTFTGLAAPAQGEPLTVPVESNGVGPPLRLAFGGVNGSQGAATELWLHNGTTAAVGPVVLRCGQLTDSEGSSLEGAEVTFDPREIESLPPRSKRAVSVSLTAPATPRAGIYRGTIQAHGAPGVWLPVEVVVPC